MSKGKETGSDTKVMRNAYSDRLSSLPDSLLVSILSLLKAKEVAQTCIRSKRWLYLWAFVPCLSFDMDDFCNPGEGEAVAFEKFQAFVTKYLQMRNEASDTHTFMIFCRVPRFAEPGLVFSKASEWIVYAVEHNVKVLNLFFMGDYHFNIPDCLFTCRTLEDVAMLLSLRGREDLRPNTVCLPRLRKLNFSHVPFYGDNLEKILLGCPVLEDFRMRYCELWMSGFSCGNVKQLQLFCCNICSGTFSISAPNADILLFDIDSDSSIILKDMSKVTQATVSIRLYFEDQEYNCYLLRS